MDGAHDAGSDASATIEIFEAMIGTHSEILTPEFDPFFKIETVDLSGFLIRDKDGDVCFNFGKNKGMKLKSDRYYCDWVLRNDFPLATKKIIVEELTQPQKA
jgi:DNA polymerase-3 subunit epsilon